MQVFGVGGGQSVGPPQLAQQPFCCWIYGQGGRVGADREAGSPEGHSFPEPLHQERPYPQGPLLAEPPVSVLGGQPTVVLLLQH